MNSRQLSIDRGVIDIRKALIFLIVFEMVALAVFLTGDFTVMGIFAAIVLAPILLILIPVEPLLGLPLMFIASGIDYFTVLKESSGGILNLTYFHIFMLITFLAVFLKNCLNSKFAVPSISLWPPLIAFMSMTLFSTIYSPYFILGFTEFARLVVLVVLSYAILISIDSKRKVKFVVWSYILVPFSVASFTIYEILTQGAFFSSQIARIATELGIPVFRSTGTFRNPNDLACFLMIGVLLSFAVLVADKSKVYVKVIMIFIIGILSVALIASFSRGGWLSTFVAVAFMIILLRKWSYAALFGGVFLLTFIILSIKFPHIVLSAYDRFSSIINPFSEDSASSRISLIKAGISMWKDHPILGVGGGGFRYYSYDYIDPNMPRVVADTVDAHTLQAKILAEQGLVGFTFAVWFFFTVLFDGIRSIKKIKDKFLQRIQVGYVALFVGFIVNFTFASDMHNNIFWITIGVIYAIPIVNQKILDAEKLKLNNSIVTITEDSS
ncbi:O-antigen ligase family protein [Candidatus Latescibacterota bacterium]